MTRERWGRIKEIFEAALEQPPEARSSFLVEVCGGDISLRGEVELLLSGRDQGANSVTQPALAALALQGVLGARPRTFKAGKVVSGRFQIVRFIGRGGMGEVYEAKDLELGAHVALKTIRPEIAWDPRTLARFKQEIQLARHVTHRNVCRMYDLEHCRPDNKGQPDITFLTMELLEGETLAERLSRRGRVRVEEALTLVCQMGEGLAAAHEVGVVHRD
ncbi:MAG TPA: serine/threonine-protein kinase, partial [Terriglobia bacterium]|nr:serine/threonine-protein kinase [Terriglobia bacterium]